MPTISDSIEAIADVAAEWRDPDHPSRAEAVEETLAAPNRWTEEALAYGLNRWMQRLTVEKLKSWLPVDAEPERLTVGGVHGASGPFDGLRDAIAALGLGHSYVGSVPDSSPAILPAFVSDLEDCLPEAQSEFVPKGVVFDRADVLMAQPEDEDLEAIQNESEAHGIPESRRLIRPPLYSVGVLDGQENDDERERLAEDMLLYEGEGRRRLALLWAPRDLPPDPYLEAMAHFRGVFPVHEDTPGTLQMQQAFLEAQDDSHAYAEGLEFLVSRGEPEPQRSAHLRWTEYDALDEVEEWIGGDRKDLYAIVARSSLHDQFTDRLPLRTPGGVHTPPLDDWEGESIANFFEEV